jgi:SnoaL-like domain
MTDRISDRLAISDLINGWILRDNGEWDKLRDLFHSDGVIEVTWFEGAFSDFVDASSRMGASDLRSKHLIGAPVVRFSGERAIAETNAVIVGENVELALGCAVHARFYDYVERREGVWRIVRRQCIYDMGSFTFPLGVVEIDKAAADQYPRQYAALAYLLEKSNFPVRRAFATKGSELERAMKAGGDDWLRVGAG